MVFAPGPIPARAGEPLADDLALFGVPHAQPDLLVIDIWPENGEVWAVWRAMETNWRLIAGVAGVAWQGLDRGGIEATLNLMGIRGRKKRRRVFEGLMEMEAAALPVLNGQDARKGSPAR